MSSTTAYGLVHALASVLASARLCTIYLYKPYGVRSLSVYALPHTFYRVLTVRLFAHKSVRRSLKLSSQSLRKIGFLLFITVRPFGLIRGRARHGDNKTPLFRKVAMVGRGSSSLLCGYISPLKGSTRRFTGKVDKLIISTKNRLKSGLLRPYNLTSYNSC